MYNALHNNIIIIKYSLAQFMLRILLFISFISIFDTQVHMVGYGYENINNEIRSRIIKEICVIYLEKYTKCRIY